MPDPPAKPASYQRYRAPERDGAALVEPSWPGIRRRLEQNRRELAEHGAELLGPGGRAAARAELIERALRFTRSFCDAPDPPAQAAEGPLVVSGHQPELFHPGVWFKNFALDAIAKDAGGIGVHLLIDSDLCRRAAVRVPTGPLDSPRVESVRFDAAADDAPFEERAVQDPAALAGFGEQIRRSLAGLVDAPLAEALTPDLTEAARETGNLGLALSHARRRLEGRWGLQTLELPVSSVCGNRRVRAVRLPTSWGPPPLPHRLHGALDAYRAAHKLRNSAQPLPDLARDNGWWEAPSGSGRARTRCVAPSSCGLSPLPACSSPTARGASGRWGRRPATTRSAGSARRGSSSGAARC